MKILSLYINNFGKLSNFSYTFNENLNEIFEENGWGKTTIAAFIKAMLFGLNERTKSIESNDRLKYAPWNDGQFGGNLVIEIKNKQYRIERTFLPKQSNKDTFELFDLESNKISLDYSENIGEEILGVNAYSYDRSIYIPQKELSGGFGSDLTSKLINLVNATDDTQNFEKSIEIIEKRYKEIKTNANKGLLIEKQNELYVIENELKNIKDKKTKIRLLENDILLSNDEIASFEKGYKEYENVRKNYDETQEIISNIKICEMHQKYIDEYQGKIDNIEAKIGNSVSLSQINEHIKIANNLEENERKLNQLNVEKNKLTEEIKNNKIYQKTSILTDDDLNDIEERIINNISSSKKVIIQKWMIFAMIADFFVMMVGFALLFYFLILGVIFVSVSIILAFIFLFISILKTNNQDISSTNRLELQKFFAAYDIFTDDYHKAFYDVQTINKERQKITDKIDNINNQITYYDNLINEANNKLSNFFKNYKIDGISYLEKLNLLEKLFNEKEFLNQRLISTQSELNIFKKDKKTEYNQDILNFNLEDLISKQKTIQQNINVINERKVTLQTERNNLQSIVDNELILEEQKDNLISVIKDLKKEYELLKKTKEFLIAANDSLAQKFVKPMKDAIMSNLSMFKDNQIKEFNLELNYDFKLFENGKNRALDFLSKGYQTMILLCMRIALIDCLFQKEKPLIILDDSFVHFDDDKIALAKDYIKTLSHKYQILYLTCHSSRKL